MENSRLKIFIVMGTSYEDYRAFVRAENEGEALLSFAEQADLHDSEIPLAQRFSAWETHAADNEVFKTVILDREKVRFLYNNQNCYAR